MNSVYKRVIVKLSGEALADPAGGILSKEKLSSIATSIGLMRDMGVDVGIVVGAGNIWRGRLAEKIGIELATADYMGMLGTIMNAMAIQSSLEEKGIACRVLSSINVNQVCEPYLRRKALHHLEKGIVTILAGGTGNPYFTTDSAAALRSLELNCDAILMAKNGVEGIYDSDPRVNPEAKMYKEISFHEIIQKKLAVMDLTAASLLDGKGVEIRVFNMADPKNFQRVLLGEDVGTVVR